MLDDNDATRRARRRGVDTWEITPRPLLNRDRRAQLDPTERIADSWARAFRAIDFE